MKLIDEMLCDVRRFNKDIINSHIPEELQSLSVERSRDKVTHLQEELEEFESAEHWADEADALVDLIYVALGALVEMGISPGSVFNAVHQANMAKVSGIKPERPDAQYDAIKPEGWVPPDIKAAAIPVSTLSALSPVLIDITELRAQRAKQYNQGSVEIEDYFPFGQESYYQMCHVKLLRAKSAIESGGDAKDSILDLINYAVFWAEAMREGSV